MNHLGRFLFDKIDEKRELFLFQADGMERKNAWIDGYPGNMKEICSLLVHFSDEVWDQGYLLDFLQADYIPAR